MSGTVIPTPTLTVANGNGHGKLPTIGGKLVDPADVAAEVEELRAPEAVAWAVERFHPDLRFAVSFQKTSSVLIDMVHRITSDARLFYVDTGLLFPETYATRDALADRYGIEFERIANGSGDWSLDRDGCCADHKVELMRTALDDVSCWVS